jgi:branched-chain amino acid transport system permease protein
MDLHTLLQVVVNGVLLGGVYALMALGINLVFGVMRVVNLAHGDFIMVGGFLTFWLFSQFGLSPLLALPLAATLGFALGGLVQWGLLRHLPRDLDPTRSSLLITFGVSYLVVNAAHLIWGSEYQTVSAVTGSWQVAGVQIARTRALAFAVAALVTALVWAFLRYTDLGRAVRAISQNLEGAAVCGIDVPRLRLFTFGLGSALATAAGAIVVMIFAVQPAIGGSLTLKSFAIAAIGGLGSFPGALLGAMVLGLAEVFSGVFASAQVANGVAFVLFLLVLLLRPGGLLARRGV